MSARDDLIDEYGRANTAPLGTLSELQQKLDAYRAEVLAEAANTPLTIYRAEYESFVFGLYTTAAAAREHCETHERRDQPTAAFDWIEDEEDGAAELVATVGGEEKPTGYVVTALAVASAYDEEADE
jgi:hypothetical protein